MCLVLICMVVRPAAPVMDNAFLVHIEKISYGIYLLHMFVICVVKKIPGGTSPLFCFLLRFRTPHHQLLQKDIVADQNEGRPKFGCNPFPADSTDGAG
jgi:hypothetical protein